MKEWWKSDPPIVLSLVNTRLRDGKKDLDGLCEEWNVPRPELEKILAGIGYRFDPRVQRFVDISGE